MLQKTFQAALKMVSHAASKKDVRYYLNGVRLEFSSHGLNLVAMDGHRLAVAIIGGDFEQGEITIGHDAIKQILAAPKSTGEVECRFEGEQLKLEMAGQVITFTDVGGKYPDWRRVVQGTPEATEVIGVNAEYMAQAMAALSKVANAKYHGVKIHLRGPNNSLKLEAGVSGDFEGLADAYCIVMPMRL